MKNAQDLYLAVRMGIAVKDLITGLVIDSERNSQLPTGDTKHKNVQLEVERYIDGHIILAGAVKQELKRNVTPAIKKTVEIMNDKGMFSHGS